MMLKNIIKKSKETPIVGLVSESNYTIVYFSDGVKTISGYTKKLVKNKVKTSELIEVRRGVEFSKDYTKKVNGKIKAFGKQYLISRRKSSNWAVILLFIFLTVIKSLGQNLAPVANNDFIRVCFDDYKPISVIDNDTDANGDRIIMHSFTQPANGYLTSSGNTGKFYYTWGGVDSTAFTYKVKDLRFGGIGSLESNTATVHLMRRTAYDYIGTYSGTANRFTCRSKNTGNVTITGTARERNETYTYIELDANIGTVLLAPSAGGVIELIAK